MFDDSAPKLRDGVWANRGAASALTKWYVTRANVRNSCMLVTLAQSRLHSPFYRLVYLNDQWRQSRRLNPFFRVESYRVGNLLARSFDPRNCVGSSRPICLSIDYRRAENKRKQFKEETGRSVGEKRGPPYRCHRQNGQGSFRFRVFGEHERRHDLQLHDEFR